MSGIGFRISHGTNPRLVPLSDLTVSSIPEFQHGQPVQDTRMATTSKGVRGRVNSARSAFALTMLCHSTGGSSQSHDDHVFCC